MVKKVSVLVGAGSIGQAIIRRVSAGKHIVLADYSEENAKRAAKTLEDAGFVCSTIQCDLGSKEDILKLVEFATNKGEVTNLVNAAGVSPSQAPVGEILRVDLYGTSVLLEEFGKVIAEGGSGVIISSQSGHRLPALPQEQNDALATTPVDELLDLSFLKEINDTLKAYQYSKRCNVLRVMFEATRWGRRGATINSISPGIIITPLANDELHGPRKEGYLKMIEGMPARRAGTPDEVGDMAEFLMSSRGRFISILFLGITTIIMQAKTDKEQIETLYRDMYEAMVAKDTVVLNRVHADDFVLTHMTGMHQSKQEYIKAITNGTLNYFSAEHEQMEIKVSGNHATLTGRSRVTAAVFGGGRHTWHLQLTFQLVKRNGQWMFTNARASTY